MGCLSHVAYLKHSRPQYHNLGINSQRDSASLPLVAAYLIKWLFIFTRSYHAKSCLLRHLTLLIPVGNTGRKAYSTAFGTCTPFCCLLNTIGTWIRHTDPKCGLLSVGWRQNPTEFYYKFVWKPSIWLSFITSEKEQRDKERSKSMLLTQFRNFKSCLFRSPG